MPTGDSYNNTLNQLRTDTPLKAWSIIITFFGDSIAPRGGAVSAPTIQKVMSTLGIGAGTVRTALSRLAKDGWITRQKSGRNSFYRLSVTGQVPFSAAEAVIYTGDHPKKTVQTKDWHLVTLPPQTTAAESVLQPDSVNPIPPGLKLNRDSFLYSKLSGRQIEHLQSQQALVSTIDTKTIPDWVTLQIAPDALAEKYRLLHKQAKRFAKHPPTDPLTALAARTLLIHEWRRLLLRSNQNFSDLLPANWPHNDCRQSIATLYHLLSPPGEHWLATEATGPDGKLPLAKPKIELRFR